MSVTKRIRYFCPDYPQPSGGVKTLYQHVNCLSSAGIDAAIVHQKRDFRLDWHVYPAPVIWLEDRPQFGADDILVFPEVMPDLIRQTRGFAGQRVVISLSWLPSYTKLQAGERWQDSGISHVIATSPAVARHLSWSMQIHVTLIPALIHPELYFYRPADKTPSVAYLTRKDGSGEWLRGVIGRRGVAPPSYEWTPLRNLDERSYADAMRKTSVFVTTTMQEGLHRSVLEAMACGCLVIGFDAIGGADFMAGEGAGHNCLSVENGNLLRLGQVLEDTLQQLQRMPGAFDAIRANAVATAQRYQDVDAERESLIAFFAELSARSA